MIIKLKKKNNKFMKNKKALKNNFKLKTKKRMKMRKLTFNLLKLQMKVN